MTHPVVTCIIMSCPLSPICVRNGSPFYNFPFLTYIYQWLHFLSPVVYTIAYHLICYPKRKSQNTATCYLVFFKAKTRHTAWAPAYRLPLWEIRRRLWLTRVRQFRFLLHFEYHDIKLPEYHEFATCCDETLQPFGFNFNSNFLIQSGLYIPGAMCMIGKKNEQYAFIKLPAFIFWMANTVVYRVENLHRVDTHHKIITGHHLN